MADDQGFANRLAYVRWLRGMGRDELEMLSDFAKAIGVKYSWLYKWAESPKSPTRRPEIKALIAGLEPMGVSEEWLIDGKGTPPRADLWTSWAHARSERLGERPTLRLETATASTPPATSLRPNRNEYPAPDPRLHETRQTPPRSAPKAAQGKARQTGKSARGQSGTSRQSPKKGKRASQA
jgi:hypothetical protein